MVVCSIAIQLYAVWKIRASIHWFALWPMIAAGLATVPLGVWMLLHTDSAVYGIGLGVFLSAYGCYAVLRRDGIVVRGSAWRDAIAGALGGVVGGLAGFPGAFVTIWCAMRGWDKLQQRAVYQPYILAMQIVTIVCLRLQGPGNVDAFDDLRFVPFAVLGGIAGLALYQRMTNALRRMDRVTALRTRCGLSQRATAASGASVPACASVMTASGGYAKACAWLTMPAFCQSLPNVVRA